MTGLRLETENEVGEPREQDKPSAIDWRAQWRFQTILYLPLALAKPLLWPNPEVRGSLLFPGPAFNIGVGF
jgi:hypothetical protein